MAETQYPWRLDSGPTQKKRASEINGNMRQFEKMKYPNIIGGDSFNRLINKIAARVLFVGLFTEWILFEIYRIFEFLTEARSKLASNIEEFSESYIHSWINRDHSLNNYFDLYFAKVLVSYKSTCHILSLQYYKFCASASIFKFLTSEIDHPPRHINHPQKLSARN